MQDMQSNEGWQVGGVVTEYKSINQIIKELGVHRNTVENWLRSGKLRGVRAGKLWRISSGALDEFLSKGASKHDEGSK